MLSRVREFYEIPEETARIARAAFPKGSPYMQLCDELGPIYSTQQFAQLSPNLGQPAEDPARLALATVMQFAEGLSDRQAADAVRGRIDWKYALALEMTDPGFDASVLSEFRGRLVAGSAEMLLFETIVLAENLIRQKLWPVPSICGRIMASILSQERQAMTSPFSFVRHGVRSVCQTVTQLLRRWTKPRNDALVVNAALDLTRSRSELMLENALLRQQLMVLKRQTKRPALSWRDRALLVLVASRLRTWRQTLLIVQPDTLLRWHRELFCRVWRRKSRSDQKPGRPPLTDEVIALIKRMARENHTWGAERIRGELLKLDIEVAKSTIQRYMRDLRGPLTSQQTWATFLRNHASQIWACDFAQTYDLFFRALFIFVILELGSRRIVHYGVTSNPTDAWVAQQLRNATPFLNRPRFLIRDNDPKYGPSFDRVAAGIEVLRTPYRVPKANAICERFLGSLRCECLDHILILGERHLHRTLNEYIRYFNQARPHQGIGQSIPCPTESLPHSGPVTSLPVLGGLHHDYRRRAA